MLDVHPPEHAAQSWRDFFTHIATIVVGLLIAIGLEQTVESIHHLHQLHSLQEQMHEVFEGNLKLDSFDLQQLEANRDYLLELRAAVLARRAGKPLGGEPTQDDRRIRGTLRIPNLAPYEAAKQNGTVALLSSDEIRLYNRVGLQREFLGDAIKEWFRGLSAIESFDERFADSRGSLEMGEAVTAPALGSLSPNELVEYQTLIATLIKQTDLMRERIHHFDIECRALLDGAHDEAELLLLVAKEQSKVNEVSPVPAPGK